MAPRGDGNIADGFRTVQGRQPTFVPISFLGLDEHRHRLSTHLHPHDHSIVWCTRAITVHLVAHRIVSTPDHDRLRALVHEAAGSRLLPEPASNHPHRRADRCPARKEARIEKAVIIHRHRGRIDVRGVAARVAHDEKSRAGQRPRQTIEFDTKSRRPPRNDLPKDRPRVAQLGDRTRPRTGQVVRHVGVEPDATHGQERLAVDEPQIHPTHGSALQPLDEVRQVAVHAEVLREQVFRAERQIAHRHPDPGGAHGGCADGAIAPHDHEGILASQRFIEPPLARPGFGRQATDPKASRLKRALHAKAGRRCLPAA